MPLNVVAKIAMRRVSIAGRGFVVLPSSGRKCERVQVFGIEPQHSFEGFNSTNLGKIVEIIHEAGLIN